MCLGDKIGCILHVYLLIFLRKLLFDKIANLYLMIQSVVKKLVTFLALLLVRKTVLIVHVQNWGTISL